MPIDRRGDREVAMSNEANSLSADARRQFLKATALGVAGAALGVRPGLSAPKTMSIMHENSFIKTFDSISRRHLSRPTRSSPALR